MLGSILTLGPSCRSPAAAPAPPTDSGSTSASSQPAPLAPADPPEPEGPRLVVDPPVARVGGTPIPWEAFFTIYDLKVGKYSARGRTVPPSAKRRYRQAIARRLVRHELLALECVAQGLDLDPAELDARMTGLKTSISDWERHLSRRGETEATLAAMVRAELRVKALRERRGPIQPTPEQIEVEYARRNERRLTNEPSVLVSHLTILGSQGKAAARRLRALAAAPGADFSALAQEHLPVDDSPTGTALTETVAWAGATTERRLDRRP